MGIRAGPLGAQSGQPVFPAAGSGSGLWVIGPVGTGLEVFELAFSGQPDFFEIILNPLSTGMDPFGSTCF